MSRFSALVNAKLQQATEQERELATTIDSVQSSSIASQLAISSPSPHSTDPGIQIAAEAARQLSVEEDIQIPPDSLMSTSVPELATRQAGRRKVDSHKRGRADSRKADRHRGDRVPFNNRLSETTVNRVKHFCVDHALEQQEFAELAAIHFMDAVESYQTEKPGSSQAHDERDLMILYKTSPTIINLYIQYNPENRWKPADDYEGVKYNDRDIRLVEVGIIQTQFNARFKRINSFKYYTTEIEMAFETPLSSETIDIMLKQGRRRWAEASGRGS